MELLIPFGGFVFVLATFGVLSRIQRDEQWIGNGLVAALAFAAMAFAWAAVTAH